MKHADKILSMIYKKHNNEKVVLLARSAGGGISIRLMMHNVENPGEVNHKIKAGLLMAPGYKPSGLVEFVKTKIDIPLFIGYVNQDTCVASEQIYQMRRQLIEAGYKRFDYVDETKQGDGHNHRFWYHLITKLDPKYHTDSYFADARTRLLQKYPIDA